MGAFSNYLEGKIVDHFLRNTPAASPTSVYLALFVSDPGETGSGTEASYPGYARQPSTWRAINSNGETSNVGTIVFPVNGHATDSITISHAAIFDAATGGNMLFHGPLATAKTLEPGDGLAWADGALVLSID